MSVPADAGSRPVWSAVVGRWVYIAALVVAATAMAGSLYYSEVLGLRPCTLCWDQRICMYSLVLILGIAVVRRDRGIVWYAFPLALIGAGIALNHLLEEGSAQPLGARAIVSSAPCAVPYFRELGFITMAFMSLSAFLLIAGLLAIGFARDRPAGAAPPLGWRIVEVTGLEPVTSSLRTKRSTGLSYTPARPGMVPGGSPITLGEACADTASDVGPGQGRGSCAAIAASKRARTTAFVMSPRVRSRTARSASVARRSPPVSASG